MNISYSNRYFNLYNNSKVKVNFRESESMKNNFEELITLCCKYMNDEINIDDFKNNFTSVYEKYCNNNDNIEPLIKALKENIDSYSGTRYKDSLDYDPPAIIYSKVKNTLYTLLKQKKIDGLISQSFINVFLSK